MYTFNTAAIFSLGHLYIESTTVLSDDYVIGFLEKGPFRGLSIIMI